MADALLSGHLRNVPLSEVFQVLVTGHKAGTLEVSRDGQVAVLELEEGRIRYASLRPGIHLGEILIRMELLSSDEVQDILASQTREHAGAPLGFAALRLGLVTDEELARAVRRQVAEVVGELLTWRDGAFTFRAAAVDRTYVPDGQAVDAMAVLMEVAGELEDRDAARVAHGAVFARHGDPTQVTLPDGAWEVLTHIDGRRSARSIAAELDLPRRRTFGVLGRLEASDVVRRVRVIDPEPRVLVLSGSDAQRRLLALVVERSGGVVQAAATLDAALTAVRSERPHAVVVDDDGDGWSTAAALRAEPGLAHVPLALITNATFAGGWRWWRRPKLDQLPRPFEEAALLAWLERWLQHQSWEA